MMTTDSHLDQGHADGVRFQRPLERRARFAQKLVWQDEDEVVGVFGGLHDVRDGNLS
jgi:hypothetical protein